MFMQRLISLLLLPSVCSFSSRGFSVHTQKNAFPLASTADKFGDDLSVQTKYKSDIKALNQLLDSNEEAKLEEVKKLVREIQELRRKSPQVALPQKVRDALVSYHSAEQKYGVDSREAKVAYEYFVDISHAQDLHPDRHLGNGIDATLLKEALNAVHVLEELKEIAHVEKAILDRFGTTDFEIGEGFLEREIGREDDDTYGLWV